MLRRVDLFAKLPLPGDARFVAGTFQKMCERRLLAIQLSEFDVVALVRLSGHQLDAGGSADRLRVAMLEPQSRRSQCVDVRRLVIKAAVR